MIALTRLDGKEMVVNADLILAVEATPDTVLTLVTGARLMVREPPAEVVERAARWRRRCAGASGHPGAVIPFARVGPED